MRRLGQLLAFALIVAAAGLAALRLAPLLDPSRLLRQATEDWKLEMTGEAAVSLAYAVDRDGVRVALPPGTDRVKLVLHALFRDRDTIRRQKLAEPSRRWNFAVTVSLLAPDGRPLFEREQHLRGNLTEWQDTAGRRLTAVYLLDRAATPGNGTSLQLDLAGLGPVAAVALRLHSLDAELEGVLARVYVPEQIPEARLDTFWGRLHERQRARLARGNVYAPELMLEEERRNLVRNLWQPAAPRGSRGTDFEVSELYVLREIDGEPIETEPLPAGLLLGGERRGTVPIPPDGGHFRFAFAPLGEPAEPPQVLLDWYGPGLGDHRRFSLGSRRAPFEWRADLDGGLVEVSASQPLALRVFGPQPAAEITPQPLYLRGFLVDAERGVDYALAHEGHAPTPLRLALRGLAPPGGEPGQALDYRFVNAAGELLAGGRLAVETPLSHYDEVLSALPGTRLSDPREVYFSVPPEAAALQLRGVGAGSLLVALATRPPSLARRERLPEDRFEFDLRGERIPAWFGTRPRDYERLVLDNRSRLLALQPRPPERDSPALQADYQWHEYRPAGAWLARPLFAPRDEPGPLREDALPSVFSPLPAGREVVVEVPPYHGRDTVEPTLAWLAADADADTALQLHIDGEPFALVRGRGAFGQWRLPPLAVGTHRIRIDGPAQVEPYLNHLAPRPGARTRRLAQRFDGALQFDYERRTRAEEFLSARLFQRGIGASRRTRLTVRIEGPQPPALAPLEHWLFDAREADVRADDRERSPVFTTAGERVDAGRPVLIPFPQGTPPGRYRIVLALAGADDQAYLALSRVAAGREARLREHLEQEDGDATP